MLTDPGRTVLSPEQREGNQNSRAAQQPANPGPGYPILYQQSQSTGTAAEQCIAAHASEREGEKGAPGAPNPFAAGHQYRSQIGQTGNVAGAGAENQPQQQRCTEAERYRIQRSHCRFAPASF